MSERGTDFSEAGFAFGFLDSLLNEGTLPKLTVPEFVTTNAEGKGLHYDAMVNAGHVAFFFQFKVPDVLQNRRRLASGAQLAKPYYKMKLRAENAYAQHIGLEALQESRTNVYYVTPRFHTAAEFDQHFRNRAVHHYSAWFRPLAVHPPHYFDTHGVVYDAAGDRWEVRSDAEKTQEGGITFKDFLRDWLNRQRDVPKRPFKEFVKETNEKLDQAISASNEVVQKLEIEPQPATNESGETVAPTDQQPPSRPSEHKTTDLEHIARKAQCYLGLQFVYASVEVPPAPAKQS